MMSNCKNYVPLPHSIPALIYYAIQSLSISPIGSQELTETSAVDIPSLPPIPVEQLDTAIGMLLAAIRINHSQQHTSPFASRLLIMTLAFLTRLIKGQALFEEREGEGEGETQTGEKVAGSLSGENSTKSAVRMITCIVHTYTSKLQL